MVRVVTCGFFHATCGILTVPLGQRNGACVPVHCPHNMLTPCHDGRHTDHAGVLEPIAHPSMARNGSGRAHGVAEAATSWHVSHGAHQRTACGEQLQLYLNGTW